MPPVATMVFSACRPDGQACIEYSWVPTGQRYSIRLGGTAVGASTDPAPAATHVQVYRLLNAGMGLPHDWQFPAGPPPAGKVLVGAYVHAVRDRAFGYAVYEDGTISIPDQVGLVIVPPGYECSDEG